VILSANLGVSLNAPKRVCSYRLITSAAAGLKKTKSNPQGNFPAAEK